MNTVSRGRARLIETEADVAAGVRALRRKCAVIRRVHDIAGDPPLRRRAAGFEGLARIIVGQQLSIASAGAIWSRCEALILPMGAASLLACSDDMLRAAGLSASKVRTLRAISEAVVNGLDLEGMSGSTDETVREALMQITGIGPWTADIYLMFCLGRADGFAPGDLALQVAAQHAFEFEVRPNAAELVAVAERWRPWRAVAARLLWAYYAVQKQQRSGAPV